MKLKNLKISAQSLLDEDQIKKAFKLLKKELKKENNKYQKFNSHREKFNLLQDKRMSSSIKLDEYDTKLIKIGEKLSTFILTLEEGDLKIAKEFTHDEISNRILVVTTKTNIKDVKNFFKQLNFVNICIEEMGSFPHMMLDQYDLIIFDNKDLKPCYKPLDLEKLKDSDREGWLRIKDRIQKMERVLKETTRPIIHYGEHLFWINNNRERVQAANFKFSLYARTREVIEFINTYRA